MLYNLLQVGTGLNASDLEALQRMGTQGAVPPAAAGLFAGMMIFTVIIAIVGIIIGIINLINMYHLVMVDKAAFEKAGEDKKKWFMNLVLIPVLSGVIMVIPLIGWIAGAVGYIYSLVMILMYFFAIKKKVGPVV